MMNDRCDCGGRGARGPLPFLNSSFLPHPLGLVDPAPHLLSLLSTPHRLRIAYITSHPLPIVCLVNSRSLPLPSVSSMGMRPFHDGERASPQPFNSLLVKQRLVVFFFCCRCARGAGGEACDTTIEMHGHSRHRAPTPLPSQRYGHHLELDASAATRQAQQRARRCSLLVRRKRSLCRDPCMCWVPDAAAHPHLSSFPFSYSSPAPCSYLAYAWTVGWHAAENMSWEPVLRRWSVWRLMRDYFKAQLHKTCDLSPEVSTKAVRRAWPQQALVAPSLASTPSLCIASAQKTYIFAMVPHGITAVSGWLTFATSTTGFETEFPGINVRALTLDANFLAPGIREYCLLSGLRSCGRKSFRNILGSGPGSAVLLVPGGAAETFLAAPGTCDLVRRKGDFAISRLPALLSLSMLSLLLPSSHRAPLLSAPSPHASCAPQLTAKRKGFVRMAIETGAHLVPVVAFGENEMFGES
jgi:hypothetical protein